MDKSLYDKNKPKKSLCVSCECSSIEHRLHFDYEPPSYTQKEFGDIYIHVYLNPVNGFFKRLVLATKYLFGYQCKYGAWDETIIRRRQIPEIIALFNEMNKDNQEFADWLVSNSANKNSVADASEVSSSEDHFTNDE